jgi:hypothetical protein
MSEIKIKRRTRSVEITLTSGTADAATLRLDDMAGAVISVGTMSTNAASLQMFGAVEPDGPYRRVYGSDGEPADVTLAPSATLGRIYALPDEVFAVPYLKIVSDAAGTGTIGVVSFKS